MDSLVGHLPTMAGLKGATADDEVPDGDWPTEGPRAAEVALSGDALRDSLLPVFRSERYTIGKEFARGGMGIVADARDEIMAQCCHETPIGAKTSALVGNCVLHRKLKLQGNSSIQHRARL